MPVIKEYTNPVDGLQPSDRGIEARSHAGREQSRLANQAAEATSAYGSRVAAEGSRLGSEFGAVVKEAGQVAVDYAQHREISQGAATNAQLTSDLTNAWNKTLSEVKDPNDPTVAVRFREEVLSPALEKFSGAFNTEGGQRWAERQVDALRNHMFEKTTADMSALAATAASTNMHQIANSLSNTAMVDPSSVPHLLETVGGSIDAIVGSSPNLKGVVGQRAMIELTEKTREQIVKAGAIGAIQKSSDPIKTSEEWGAKYPKYINGAELKQLGAEALRQKRLQTAEDRAIRAETKREDLDAFNKAANQFELGTTREAPDGRVEPFSPKDLRAQLGRIALLPGAALEPARMAALVHRAEQLGRVTDEGTRVNLQRTSDETAKYLTDLMNRPEDDPSRLTDPRVFDDFYVKDKLTYEMKNRLRADFFADRSPTGEKLASERAFFLKEFESSIDPARNTVGIKSAAGSAGLYKFSQYLRDKEVELRKAGKDPRSLYDANSPDFAGNPKVLQNFSTTLVDATRSQRDSMRPRPPTPNLTDSGTVISTTVTDLPPLPGATRNKDGTGWVVRQGGKSYNVKELP